MPLSDFPQTSAAQLAQVSFPIGDDQIHGAIDGGIRAITDPESNAYWADNIDISILEASSGKSLAQICAGLQAGRDCRNPDNVRAIKYIPAVPGPTAIAFVHLDVVLTEAALGISLVALRDAMYDANF